MNYRFKPTEGFWESFYDLTARQKDSARRAWKVFKRNPFDPRLRSHTTHSLSAYYGRTIYAADVEHDLRVVFYVERDCVVTVDIGTHDVYRG
jgi:mRNA-degrading endonuclease YafQ of YafQ-DinJ toxin-antitoxin module